MHRYSLFGETKNIIQCDRCATDIEIIFKIFIQLSRAEAGGGGGGTISFLFSSISYLCAWKKQPLQLQLQLLQQSMSCVRAILERGPGSLLTTRTSCMRPSLFTRVETVATLLSSIVFRFSLRGHFVVGG